MASAYGVNFGIDYAIPDGRVRSFDLNGIVYKDEDKNIEHICWKGLLVSLINVQGFNIDKGMGIMSFVHKLIEEGLVMEKSQ